MPTGPVGTGISDSPTCSWPPSFHAFVPKFLPSPLLSLLLFFPTWGESSPSRPLAGPSFPTSSTRSPLADLGRDHNPPTPLLPPRPVSQAWQRGPEPEGPGVLAKSLGPAGAGSRELKEVGAPAGTWGHLGPMATSTLSQPHAWWLGDPAGDGNTPPGS